MGNGFLRKISRPFHGKRVFTASGAGTTGYSHAKQWSWIPTSHYRKKWIQNGKTIKLLEGNKSVNPHDLGLGNGFSNMTSKAQATKGKNR